MAKFVKSAKRLQQLEAMKRATREAGKELQSPAFMKKLGEMAAKMIKTRTRLGFGVAKQGDERAALKPLAKSTIEERKGNIAFWRTAGGKTVAYPKKPPEPPKLHPHARPSRSNLTRTGQLLDSIGVKSARARSVVVGPMGERQPDPRAPGLKPPSNQQVAEYVAKERPFNSLSGIEMKRIKDAVLVEVRKMVRSKLTNKK